MLWLHFSPYIRRDLPLTFLDFPQKRYERILGMGFRHIGKKQDAIVFEQTCAGWAIAEETASAKGKPVAFAFPQMELHEEMQRAARTGVRRIKSRKPLRSRP